MKKWVLGKWNSFLVCNYWGGHYFTQVSIMHLFLSHYVYVSLIQVPRSCLLISSKRLEIREMGSWGNGIMQEQLQIWTEHSTLIFENSKPVEREKKIILESMKHLQKLY